MQAQFAFHHIPGDLTDLAGLGRHVYVRPGLDVEDDVQFGGFGVTASQASIDYWTQLKPAVKTTTPSEITDSSATIGGNVIDDGGADVTARGVCWGNFINPTINDQKTENGTGTGIFTSSIKNLKSLTVYYVRAYAKNAVGVAYGENKIFTTSPTKPIVETLISGIN